VKPTRQVLVGWTYEDDETLQLAKQQGYQGAFTLFRDLYMKVTENVDPTTPGLNANQSSWLVTPATNASSNSTTMGVTVTTLGQRVIPEITSAYKSASKVTTPQTGAVPFGYTPFTTQPSGRHYALYVSSFLHPQSIHIDLQNLRSERELLRSP
jgi:beta-fructofuranosidase